MSNPKSQSKVELSQLKEVQTAKFSFQELTPPTLSTCQQLRLHSLTQQLLSKVVTLILWHTRHSQMEAFLFQIKAHRQGWHAKMTRTLSTFLCFQWLINSQGVATPSPSRRKEYSWSPSGTEMILLS